MYFIWIEFAITNKEDSLKFLFLSFLLSHYAFGSLGKIDESFIVLDPSKWFEIQKISEMTVDHLDEHGFELYGPKGTSDWLDLQDIPYIRVQASVKSMLSNYPSYIEVVNDLKRIAAINPTITKLFSIGKTVEGRDMWVLKISDNVDYDEIEPEVKYISSMHGDEIVGRELTRFFAEDLINNYGVDSSVTEFINNTEIYIMPSMNPDGSEKGIRANANGYDLNRDFPDWKNNDDNYSGGRQIETKNLMSFQSSRHFSLSANYHGGAVVVNYPWDATYDKHPFDQLVIDLSLSYADLNSEMRNSMRFNRGITNGANWYVLRGGMQDWSYYYHDDLQVTIEVSTKKWPNYSTISYFYSDNKDSMITYLKKVHQGLGFYAQDKVSQIPLQIYKVESNRDVNLGRYIMTRGEFYKVLEPGEYKVELKYKNNSHTVNIEVMADQIKMNGNFISLDSL